MAETTFRLETVVIHVRLGSSPFSVFFYEPTRPKCWKLVGCGVRPLRPRLARHLSDYPLKRGAHLRLFARQLLLVSAPLRLL